MTRRFPPESSAVGHKYYTMTSQGLYDVVIIGGGPAGLSAGIYASRGRLKTILIEKGAIGGAIVNASLVENYPGFPDGVSGIDLTQAMYRQAVKFGLETVTAEVTAVVPEAEVKLVRTTEGDYRARALIIAGGSERAKLGVPGEAEFTGRGVSYCATCDGAFFRDKVVAVVGGGDSAVTDALELTHFARKVFLIHRRHELRATRVLQERALNEKKIEFVWESAVTEIKGEKFVNTIRLRHVKTGAENELAVDGVFVSVGNYPATAYLKGVVALDSNGAVVVNEKMETSARGIFAAGDIRSGSIRQVISAAGDGAVAAVSAAAYLGV
ncbi:MAG: thioredoxin-disulfide reductase [Dehalococcoidales bacterium]|nr:thioredoxin-disulfide reductase [Dehalococcoidales bacterium]